MAAAAWAVVMFLLGACSGGPSTDELNQVIRRHFEARGYTVVELVTGGVEPLGMAEKRYMGTEGYTVRVRRIVLEVPGRPGLTGGPQSAGRMSFTDALVSLREDPGERGRWLVTQVRGIPLP